MADNNKLEKIAAAKKKLKQFQKSGRARSVSRNRGSSEREIPKDREPVRAESPLPSQNDGVVQSDVPEQPVNMEGQERTTASTESLQQLSRQINGLISEERNRDLAAHLEKHVQANEQLNTQNHQLREHSKALQDQLEAERNLFHEKQRKDIGSLKEQLQVHIQTIGILVAEKTELQSQVNQSQRIADQRIEEIEELSGRLKASRQRVTDLERSLSTSSQASHQLEKATAGNVKELDRLKLELYKSDKQAEELKQQMSEITVQLQSKVSESQELSATVQELQKKLEMTELYAQQLSSENAGSRDSVDVLNSLQKERDSLLARLHQHEELTQKLQLERDQVSEQYQQYTDQLRHQSQQLTQQITALTEEREELLNKQHELEETALRLQRNLEDVKESHQAPPTPSEPQIPEEVTQELERLRGQVAEITSTMEGHARNNMSLARLLEEKEEKILSLERSVEEMGQQAGDQAQLLENVQGDKMALSRALTQNKELKIQLAELQQGFVKMSTDNMELVTKLQAEQHLSAEMSAKLAEQTEEVTGLRNSCLEKDGELSEMRLSSQSNEKEMYQQEQVKDRLRHYEAQAQLVDTLQNELTAAQDMMEALTTQNSELRTMLIKATEVKPSSSTTSEDGEVNNGRDEIVESLQSTIRQLESERGQMYENLKEQRQLSDSLGIKIADLQEEVIRRTADNADSEKISRSEYMELKTAMEMIQEKYMLVMRDKADLSDKADQLEHLVLQLQGESDTIGEYISLYHHQRALLQQRETQKNDYIAQLAHDREQLQDKLGELQALVMQLLGERNMLHSYTAENRQPREAEHITQQQQQQQPQKNKELQSQQKSSHQFSNGTMNSYDNDWPDYTSSESDTDSEVEPIVGGQNVPSTPDSELTPTSSPPNTPREGGQHPAHREDMFDGNMESTSLVDEHHPHRHDQHHEYNHSSQHNHHHHHHHHHPHQHHQPHLPPAEDDRTAHKILSLLTELGHSHMVDQVPLIDRNFLPCKFCKGAVQIV